MSLPHHKTQALLDARDDLVYFGEVPFLELRRRLRHAVPTSSHARRLAFVLLEQLGDRGRLDPYTDGSILKVLRHDRGEWLVRHPVATFTPNTTQTYARTAYDIPSSPEPAEGKRDPALIGAPHLDLKPAGGEATLNLRSGHATIELSYGADGIIRDSSILDFGDCFSHERWGALRPPAVDPHVLPAQAPPPAWFLDLPDHPIDLDELARRILLDGPARDPIRIRMNVDTPGGTWNCWAQARKSLRYLAWNDALPTSGGVCIVDAFDHPPEQACVGWGPDLDAALQDWLRKEPVVRPRPAPTPPTPAAAPAPPARSPFPPQTSPTVQPDDNVIDLKKAREVTFSARTTVRFEPLVDIPWPIPGPQTTPLIAIEIPALRTEIPQAWREQGYSRWRYRIADSGRITQGLIRDEDDGFIEVAEALVDVLDPVGLSELLRETTMDLGSLVGLDDAATTHPYEHRLYEVWSNVLRSPVPLRCASVGWGPDLPWRNHDGDYLSSRIRRLFRLRDP